MTSVDALQVTFRERAEAEARLAVRNVAAEYRRLAQYLDDISRGADLAMVPEMVVRVVASAGANARVDRVLYATREALSIRG